MGGLVKGVIGLPQRYRCGVLVLLPKSFDGSFPSSAGLASSSARTGCPSCQTPDGSLHQSPRFPLKGSFKWDIHLGTGIGTGIDIDMDIDSEGINGIDIDVAIDSGMAVYK